MSAPVLPAAGGGPTRRPDGYVRAAALDDVDAGALLGVGVAGERVCLARVGDDVTALADACSHAAFPLSAGDLCPDGAVQCAWHGARFDARTGAVLRGPACDAVRAYDVLVVDGAVYVRLDTPA